MGNRAGKVASPTGTSTITTRRRYKVCRKGHKYNPDVNRVVPFTEPSSDTEINEQIQEKIKNKVAAQRSSKSLPSRLRAQIKQAVSDNSGPPKLRQGWAEPTSEKPFQTKSPKAKGSFSPKRGKKAKKEQDELNNPVRDKDKM